jgi:sulfonate transport system permease protein
VTVTEDRIAIVDETPMELSPKGPVELVALRTTDPVAPGRRRRLRFPRSLERFLGVVALLALWQIASTARWITERSLAGPLDVTSTFWDMLTDGTLTTAMWASLQRVVIGLIIGVAIGVLLALFSGLSRIGENLTDAPMHMLRFVPIIALQPLFVLWLGIGETTKISLIVLGTIFPVYVNTANAIRSIDPKNLELAHTVGLGRWATIRRVVLPAALPSFLVGFRLATGVAWLLLVFAEQINAKSGIGYLVIKAQTFFQTDVMVVCLLVYAALGLLSDFGVRTLERRLLRWQPGR